MSAEQPASGPGFGLQPALPVLQHEQQQQKQQQQQQQNIQRQPKGQHQSPQQNPQQPRQPQQQQQQQQQHPQQQQQQQPPLDPSSMKLTRGTSCVLCQQRKVRCDKNKPCANCVKAGVECRVIPPQPPRRRKKRLQEKDLIERLKKYEVLLNEHGVKFDAIGQDLRSDGQQLDDVDELQDDFEGLKTSPEASASPSAASTSHVEKPTGAWFSLHKEFRASEQLLQDSSDEDPVGGSTIHRAFDKMFDNQDGFPFMVGGRTESIVHCHPSTIHIFQLWQIYIDNINPLLKITHVPSVQGQVIEATTNLEKAPKNIEALMFGMYVMAISSLDDGEVQRRFNQGKKDLLARFFPALQQALVNASFMRVNDSICLQALLLYLLAVRWYVDPRQVFCLIGIAVRIAQRMGLHRDPAGFGLPPFEVEQRRRLWWNIVGYDRRIGEMTGSTVTALSTGGDCKLPLNVNDSDLHMDGKDLPTPHSGPTEMLFALTRMELSMAVASNSNRDSYKMNNTEKNSPAAQSPAKPQGPIIRLAGQDGPGYTLDGFCAHIEGTYLSHCDPKIPLHFFTLTMTRQALCKMRVMNFLVRLHNSEAMPLKEVERDSLFLQAIQMIEYDNVVYSSESLQPFKWYAMHHFPFPAYMFLVQELRNRVAGPMVERAWEAITANYELRGILNHLHNPMHGAFAGTFIKAWDAHETYQRSAGRPTTKPHFIGVLQERAEMRRRARAQNRNDPNLEQPPVAIPRLQDHGHDSSQPSPANSSIMTPPVDPAMAPIQVASQMGPAPADEPGDMDWSYLVSGYSGINDNYGGGFSPFGGFGPGMGGGMGPMGGGMGGDPRGGHGGGHMYGN